MSEIAAGLVQTTVDFRLTAEGLPDSSPWAPSLCGLLSMAAKKILPKAGIRSCPFSAQPLGTEQKPVFTLSYRALYYPTIASCLPSPPPLPIPPALPATPACLPQGLCTRHPQLRTHLPPCPHGSSSHLLEVCDQMSPFWEGFLEHCA